MRQFLSVIFVSLLLISTAYAQPMGKGVVAAGEEDGSPICFGWQLKFANSNVTDNGDGTCSIADQTGAGGGDAITVNTTAVVDPDFQDNIYIDTTTGSNIINWKFNYAETLAGDPALLVDECIWAKDTSGGFILCEGSTADTNEQLYRFPDVNGADTTTYITLTSNTDGTPNIVDDATPQLGGTLDAQGNNFTGVGDILFQTGATGGTLSTGTSAADKFVLEGYDVNGAVYINVFEIDANNTVTATFNEGAADLDIRIEGSSDTELFYTDAGNNRVGISTTTPSTTFDVAGTSNATTLTEGGNAVFNSTETPGGELGGTWASPTIDDSIGVTSWSLTTPNLLGKVDSNNSAVDDDDCTGEQGLYWYDTTDSAFEFCNDNAGTPAVLGGGSGAPTDADYLVGTTNGSLSAEIVVGTSPGGELGGTWGTPTIDDSITVDGWVMGASTATTPSADDNDTSLATTAYVQTEINAMGGRSLSASSGSMDADVELYTETFTWTYPDNPLGTDDNKSVWCNDTANAFTVTKLRCESDQTVTMMLQVDDGTPADMDTVDLVCISTPDTDTSLDGDAEVAAGECVDVATTSVSGTPTWASVTFTGTWND